MVKVMMSQDVEALSAHSHALVTPGFGPRLIRARLEAGFTSQTQLARATGLHLNTVCQHETERRAPSSAAIVAYCRVLPVSAAYLQYGLGDPTIPTAVQHYLMSYRGLNLLPETRARLVAMPWALIVDGAPTMSQVSAMARLVDSNLRAREHLPHVEALPSSDDEVSEGPGQEHADRSRLAPRCA